MSWNYKYVGTMARAYRKAFDHLKADPENTVVMRRYDKPMNLEEFRREFLKALDRRINLKGEVEPKGRKTDYDYEWRLRRDARAIFDRNTKRIRIYQFETEEARKRFSHLLSSYGD